jgi:hypothetical protein
MNPWNDPNLDELATEVRAYIDSIESSHCLVVSDPEHLPPDTRLLVTCGADTVEFTILDSKSCQVRVKDGRHFKEPVIGKLLGTRRRAKKGTAGSIRLGEWQMLPGRLLREGRLVYEVDGKEHTADGIRSVQIVLASGNSFDLWSD